MEACVFHLVSLPPSLSPPSFSHPPSLCLHANPPQVHDKLTSQRQQTRSVTGSAAMIRRLEAERDDAQLELQQVSTLP